MTRSWGTGLVWIAAASFCTPAAPRECAAAPPTPVLALKAGLEDTLDGGIGHGFSGGVRLAPQAAVVAEFFVPWAVPFFFGYFPALPVAEEVPKWSSWLGVDLSFAAGPRGRFDVGVAGGVNDRGSENFFPQDRDDEGNRRLAYPGTRLDLRLLGAPEGKVVAAGPAVRVDVYPGGPVDLRGVEVFAGLAFEVASARGTELRFDVAATFAWAGWGRVPLPGAHTTLRLAFDPGRLRPWARR